MSKVVNLNAARVARMPDAGPSSSKSPLRRWIDFQCRGDATPVLTTAERAEFELRGWRERTSSALGPAMVVDMLARNLARAREAAGEP